MKIEFFEDKKVTHVACGNRFTVAVVLTNEDKLIAKSMAHSMKDVEEGHVSSGLETILKRRIGFK